MSTAPTTPTTSAAPKADLKKFFNPSSVALVGATDDLSRFAGKVLMRMTDFGYKGKIYPVNPRFKGQKVRGFDCYASVRDLPEAPDHVGVVVPAQHVLGILEDCAARGAKFVTVYTGGFAESGTAEGAVWMPLSEMVEDSDAWRAFKAALPREKQLILFCKTGGRAGRMGEFLACEGFQTANLGGFSAWKNAGLPVRVFSGS